MNKLLKISLRDLWFAINGISWFVLIISWMVGAENVFGVCGTILILLSYPCNILFGWLFIELDSSANLPIVTFLMISAIGYAQWFILLPRITNFFRQKFSKQDLNIGINIQVERMHQITEPSLGDMRSEGWQPEFYDENKNSPVERLIYDESSPTASKD